MSVRMWFTAVTREQLARLWRDPGDDDLAAHLWDGRGGAGDLDTSWGVLDYLLKRARSGVDLRFGGDFVDDEGAFHAWDRPLVRAAAERLRATAFTDLEPYLDPEAMLAFGTYPHEMLDDGDLVDARERYERLRAFFDDAAAADTAAVMVFSY